MNLPQIAEVKKVSIGGIDIGIYTSKEHLIKSLFEQFTLTGTCQTIIAINPEKVILGMNDISIKSMITDCDVKYADGIGIVWAIKQKTGISMPRVPGCELWESLMKYSGENNFPVFLVGGESVVVEKTKEKLQKEYQTPVIGFQNGYFEDEVKLIADIKTSGAKLVTVAMGSPRQEELIFKCRDAGINAIFMGVGGTYDVFTGNVKRAPVIWQNMGLEWLYRLLSQPTRWRRQINLLKFIWLYINNRL